LPTVSWIMFITFFLFWFISSYTVLGTNIYAVGGNPKAARSIGINVDSIKIITLVGTSFFSAIVGILYVARVSSGNSTVGEGMEFDVIAAVVVGGTALGGAVGRMTGTFLGVLFIAMIGNGLIHWGIDPDLNKVVRGIIIFLALYSILWLKIMLNIVVVAFKVSAPMKQYHVPNLHPEHQLFCWYNWNS